MAISDQARNVLCQQAKEVLAAKYAQEITVGGAPNRPVTFSGGTVGLDELDEWLGRLDRRAKVTNIAVIIPALSCIVAALIIFSWLFVVYPHFTDIFIW